MIILIDGYNLLKKIHGENVTETHMRAFVNLLGAYIKKRNHKIKVILDGGGSGFIVKEKQKGIDVWYSGYKQSADEVIIEYVADHKEKDLLVVTLDRELCQKIHGYGIETIDPLVFYERVKGVCQGSATSDATSEAQVHKLTYEDDAYTDAVMYEAAGMKVPYKDERLDDTRRVSAGNKLSKKEKIRQKALDKL